MAGRTGFLTLIACFVILACSGTAATATMMTPTAALALVAATTTAMSSVRLVSAFSFYTAPTTTGKMVPRKTSIAAAAAVRRKADAFSPPSTQTPAVRMVMNEEIVSTSAVVPSSRSLLRRLIRKPKLAAPIIQKQKQRTTLTALQAVLKWTRQLPMTILSVLFMSAFRPKRVLAARKFGIFGAKAASKSAAPLTTKTAILSTYARRSFAFLRSHKKPVLLGVLAVWSFLALVDLAQVRRRQRTDVMSEWERYSRQPGARGRALGNLLFGKVAPVWCLSQIPLLVSKKRKQALLEYSGETFAQGLLKLGPLYIKMGQILSCRENLLPEPWVEAMELLQDRVPAKSGQAALDLAYAAWPDGKEGFHETFSNFESTPLAAASLGQVHKAELGNGEVVAIKLQRPFLREIYDQDFKLMTKVASGVDKFASIMGEGKSVSWTEIFEDAEAILYREIDYRDEADNAIRFCDDFGLNRNGASKAPAAKSRDGEALPSAAPWVRSPYVYGDLSTEKVLVMEFVPSIKITNDQKLLEANVTEDERIYLADCLGRSYLRQFCCNGFFSTDPHPGNLGVEILKSSSSASPEKRVRLVFYDFGQAAELNQNQSDGILDIIEAIVDMDVDKSMTSFQKMGVLKPDADLDVVRAKVADNYKTGKVKANRKRLKKRGYEFKEATSDAVAASGNSTETKGGSDAQVMTSFVLPAEYAFVARALSQMDGVGKSLDPDFDFVSAAAPWIVEIKGARQYVKDEIGKFFDNIFKR